MADTAAHLVDRVLPEVPVRQWVLLLPFGFRYRLAYDAPLTGAVPGIVVRMIFASLRRRARRRWRFVRGQCDAATFVQRFGDALNRNVHFHSLLLDGVYERRPDVALRCGGCVATAPGPTRLVERRGRGPEADPSEVDPLAEDRPLLAQLYDASVASRIATGRRAGQRVLRLGDRIDPDDLPALERERCASVIGVHLHANVAAPARDRRRLECLRRCLARLPVATERLSRMEGGRLLYPLEHRWRDDTTNVVFEPEELVEKLAALAPPPRFHVVRRHGILGPCASVRERVVPGADAAQEPARLAHCRGMRPSVRRPCHRAGRKHEGAAARRSSRARQGTEPPPRPPASAGPFQHPMSPASRRSVLGGRPGPSSRGASSRSTFSSATPVGRRERQKTKSSNRTSLRGEEPDISIRGGHRKTHLGFPSRRPGRSPGPCAADRRRRISPCAARRPCPTLDWP
jgi:hypothetical protein